MEEASLTGTLRTILILLVIWLVIRLLTRGRGKGGRRFGQADPEPRPKGDVRIEQPGGPRRPGGPDGPVEDADYEEVR